MRVLFCFQFFSKFRVRGVSLSLLGVPVISVLFRLHLNDVPLSRALAT